MNSHTLIDTTTIISLLLSFPFFVFGFVNIKPKKENYSQSSFLRKRIEDICKSAKIEDYLYIWARTGKDTSGNKVVFYVPRFLSQDFIAHKVLFVEKENSCEFELFWSSYTTNKSFIISIDSDKVEKLVKEPLFCENIITENSTSLSLKMVTMLADSIYVFKCKFKNSEKNIESEEFLLFVDQYKLKNSNVE